MQPSMGKSMLSQVNSWNIQHSLEIHAGNTGAAVLVLQAIYSVMLDGTQSFEHNVASGPGGATYIYA